MRLCTIMNGGKAVVGVKNDDGKIIDLSKQMPRGPKSVVEILAGGKKVQAEVAKACAKPKAGATVSAKSAKYLPPIPNPGKILCIGLNYRKHAEETGAAIPTTPVLFSKFLNTVAAPDEDVPLTDAATQYDYEVELAVVMGETTKRASAADALNSVFGYATANDLSARDLQNRTSQWLLGKTMDKFMPIGPYLVTADEVGDPQKLAIRTWLNGELRQNSNTDDMIFPVAELITYISRHFTLEPGDVIITGTPEGVILGMAEKRWMTPGDVVEVEVEGLGKLRNRMVAG